MSDSTHTTPLPTLPPPVPANGLPTGSDNIVTDLLKNPGRVAGIIATENAGLFKSSLGMLAAALICHAVFGAAIGLFAGWNIALLDAAKAPLIALCSLLLCFPSLYVFSCVAGSPLTLLLTWQRRRSLMR